MKCGGSTKTKMAKGGVIAKEKANIYGIPQENMGTSGQYGKMQKGGKVVGVKTKSKVVLNPTTPAGINKAKLAAQDWNVAKAKLSSEKEAITKKYFNELKKATPKLQKGGSHPGFKKVQNSIASKQGVSKEAAGAILASATRKASPAAKKANPRLKRVK